MPAKEKGEKKLFLSPMGAHTQFSHTHRTLLYGAEEKGEKSNIFWESVGRWDLFEELVLCCTCLKKGEEESLSLPFSRRNLREMSCC